MIFDYFKQKVDKTDIYEKCSKYLPKTFMVDKPFAIDDSITILYKNSAFKFPSILTAKEFKQWRINDLDDFEEIITDNKSYKLLYDQTNDTLYLMNLVDVSSREDINNDSVHVGQRVYDAATELLEIPGKNELFRVYARGLCDTNDDAEYMFVEFDKNMLQKCWMGVIIEISLVN